MTTAPETRVAANRRAGRRLPPRARVKVTCRKGSLDLGPNLAVTLLDISQSGARLVVRGELAVRQEVFLTLEGAASGRQARRLAEVVWCVPVADGASCVGLRLQKPLPYADLDHFARA
jgi:hypothetical protein